MTTTSNVRPRRLRLGDALERIRVVLLRPRRAGTAVLRDLDDYMLKDIGLVRSQVELGTDDPSPWR
jgi:uncharacterized protein YjiS (DUF1127 family)